MILERIAEAQAAGARLAPCCEIVGIDMRTVQRWRNRGVDGGEDERRGPKTEPGNKLSGKEREDVLKLLNSPEYANLSPNQIVPKLADLGIYICSESTMYRLLREAKMLAHRSAAKPATRRRPTAYEATGPNQVWCWDISYLKSPVTGQWFYLYMIVDVWSRYIVGWRVEANESEDLAAKLVAHACKTQDVDRDDLVLHSDNGGPMKGSTMLATLQALGIVASFSRPSVSDDNAFIEALFRTFKYRPGYPRGGFDSLEAARAWVAAFVAWYNDEHQHSAIRYVTPSERHDGREGAILENRRHVYERARQKHPERWTSATRNWSPTEIVRLNPRRETTESSGRQAA